MMTYEEYTDLFEEILSAERPNAPYNNPDYLNYTKLNKARMHRWMKTSELMPSLVDSLKEISQKQHWIILSEPWCGDASHVLPWLIKMIQQSEKISYEIQLRDKEPFLIEKYLTNGGKSIPKLIARNEKGDDLFTWGPRPHGAFLLMNQLNEQKADFETVKTELQNWYNNDKGIQIQQELQQLMQEK